jgi:cytochrome c-type biogenesis protein CcmH/NrfG
MSVDGPAIAASVLVSAAGFLLTRPQPLRKWRALRILLTLPVVWWARANLNRPLELGTGIPLIVCCLVLTLLWFDVGAHYAAGGVSSLVFGSGNAPTGFQPDFSIPRAFERRGEFEEAIEHARNELAKAPLSYEGLLLLAGLYERTGRAREALSALEILLTSEALTEAQRELAQQRHDELAQKLVVHSLNMR